MNNLELRYKLTKIVEPVFATKDHNDIDKAVSRILSLFPTPLTEEELEKVLPKKKDNGYIGINGDGIPEFTEEGKSNRGYNQAIDDCKTALISKKVGDRVNVEADILGKYVEKLLGREDAKSRGLGWAMLREHGFLKGE